MEHKWQWAENEDGQPLKTHAYQPTPFGNVSVCNPRHSLYDEEGMMAYDRINGDGRGTRCKACQSKLAKGTD